VKNGAGACPTGSVPAIQIEAFVVDQIKKIGADPALCDETFRQVQAQVAAERCGPKAEAKRVEREITTARSDVGRLTGTLTMANGPAADALMARLTESQERLITLECRQREVAGRQVALDGQDVDPKAVGRTLAQFTEIWDVLLTPERERVVRLLIDHMDYAAVNGELTITFSAPGAKLFAAEVGS
jgi:hypothetical protein